MTKLSALILLVLFHVGMAAIFEPSFEKQLKEFVNVTMKCRHVPGLTISVVKGSETWAQGFGTADFESKRPVENTTLFGIGSVTKSFTMTLLGILLTEKNMTWTTKVSTILGPEYELVGEFRNKELTLRDLLSHRTGLPRLDIGLLAGFPDNLSRASYCKKMKYVPEARPFRDGYIYNNFMYMYLGYIAEVLGGDTWENLVTSKVLMPIGMTSTRILKVPHNVLQHEVARPYIFKDGRYQNGTLNMYDIHPSEPAGAILSSGLDMTKYIKFHLQNGKTESGKLLLDKTLLEEAYVGRSIPDEPAFFDSFLTKPTFPVSDTVMGYGYAWFSTTYRGIFASVNGPAFKNFASNALVTIFYHVSDHLLQLTPWLNETTTCSFPEPWKHTKTNSSSELVPPGVINDLSEYKGFYSSLFLPGINVTFNSSDKQNLYFRCNRLGGVFHSTKIQDKFLMEFTSPWEIQTSITDDNNNTLKVNATFFRNEGNVQSLEIEYDVKIKYEKYSSMQNTNSSQGSILDYIIG